VRHRAQIYSNRRRRASRQCPDRSRALAVGDYAGGGMAPVIDNAIPRLAPDEREAMAADLRAASPIALLKWPSVAQRRDSRSD
jgi:hypothetical protein